MQGEKFMLVTDFVLKKLGPRMRDVRPEQELNIEAIFVTAEVLIPEKLMEVRAEHWLNI